MSNIKIFTSKKDDDTEVELKFLKPSQKIVSRGDFIYREHFGKSVRAGLLTNAEAEKLLKDRNIWGPERESEAVDLQVQINEFEGQFTSETPLDADGGLKAYKELKDLREALEALGNIRRSIIDNTAEAVAAEMRTQFYASECVVYNHNGQRVFKSLDDFTSKLGERMALDSYRHALIANYESVFGIDLSKVDETDSRDVEDKWLDNLQKTEDKTDEPEKPTVDEKEAKPKTRKKRRTKKKKAKLEE